MSVRVNVAMLQRAGSGGWALFAARKLNVNSTEGTKFHGTRGLNTAGIWPH